MNLSKQSLNGIGLILCSAATLALTGCTTYVQSPQPSAYVPPPAPAPVYQAPAPVYVEAPPAVIVIRSERDFYEPLNPYGEWVEVSGYGRCWRPARRTAEWRPYSEGHWQRTDAGWYWESDEPWAWATYHYGRWDLVPRFGWVWVPQTEWAPAWVAWRQGAGYVGWAPLPPSARFSSGGVVEVREEAIAPHFVFVEERRMLEPVRPTTVIVNNTTVINQTINITKIKVVNKTVINEGPRPENVERVSGRKVQPIAVRELRQKDENEADNRRRHAHSDSDQKVERNTIAPEPQRPAPIAQPSTPRRGNNDERDARRERPTPVAPAPRFQNETRPVVTAPPSSPAMQTETHPAPAVRQPERDLKAEKEMEKEAARNRKAAERQEPKAMTAPAPVAPAQPAEPNKQAVRQMERQAEKETKAQEKAAAKAAKEQADQEKNQKKRGQRPAPASANAPVSTNGVVAP